MFAATLCVKAQITFHFTACEASRKRHLSTPPLKVCPATPSFGKVGQHFGCFSKVRLQSRRANWASLNDTTSTERAVIKNKKTERTSSQLCEIRAGTTGRLEKKKTLSIINLFFLAGQFTTNAQTSWAARYSPVQSARSYSCGDSPVARGESSCSSISASRASRRSPSSPNRHWLQNCRLKTHTHTHSKEAH